jgi:hypothetical protein
MGCLDIRTPPPERIGSTPRSCVCRLLRGWLSLLEVVWSLSYYIYVSLAMFDREILDQSWLPGRSVGHADADSGSVGLFVEVTPETKRKANYDPDAPMTAFVSAAHVLAPPTNNAEVGDHILSPCPPFAKRVATNRQAKLVDFVPLKISPHTSLGPRSRTNEFDVAVAALQKPVQTHNRVPKPEPKGDGGWEPGGLTQLSMLVPRDMLKQLLEDKEPVFKIGRKTGFSYGALTSVTAPTTLLQLPDGSPIFYKNLCCIASQGRAPFADGGDSGAVIYTKDLRIVGFVVGSRGNDTFFYHAKTALDEIGAIYPIDK